jgi:hypothetical protein
MKTSKFKPKLVVHAIGVCAAFLSLHATPSGTRGLAIPNLVCADNSGLYVGFVTLDITSGWLNSPHTLNVTIVSNNGVPDEPHGEENHLVKELALNGDPTAGRVEVIVEWTSDTNPTTIDHEYQVTAQLIFGDNQPGEPTTAGPFYFTDCEY